MMSLENSVRIAASQEGFALCGFAPVVSPPHAEFVAAWLASGNAAEMAYIARGLDKRFHPDLLLPGARTVITLGYRYQPPPVPPLDWRRELRGRIAAYALGADYHDVIAAKLRALSARLGEHAPQAQFRAYVDGGPVLEREWAALGGIGWFGKNTNILHREHGSWFFLAELLTDLELAPDEPVPDRCGSCTSCLDLCPTRALTPGYRLDARRCISYWTIEHRGSIPIAMRPQLENWVFGCDVCQEVCPWNEKLARERGSTAAPELFPSLTELLALSEEQFRARFRATAVARTKRTGLARNVAIVLGNTGNEAAIAPLARCLASDPSALVRAHAAWGLGNYRQASARRALEEALARDGDDQVRGEARAALDAL